MVYFLDGDVSRRILIQAFNDWLNMHEIDVFQRPGIVLVDASTPLMLSSVDLEGVLLIFSLLKVIIMDCENEMSCFDDAPPSLHTAQSSMLDGKDSIACLPYPSRSHTDPKTLKHVRM